MEDSAQEHIAEGTGEIENIQSSTTGGRENKDLWKRVHQKI